jgi:DNA invertase Pin-like site-specific DNA recombinase
MSSSGAATPVVSYARISADTRRDEHGVQDQHALNHATAERYGWTVVHEFTDNDKSAAKAGVIRDEFEDMLRVLRAGKLADGTPVRGALVVADDRLARRPGDYERFVEAITYQDGRVYADARGPKDLYSEDVESMGLFGAVISKMEVRKMQRRMRTSHRARADQGKPPGGTRPFGWKEDRLTLDHAEAHLLRRAAEDFIAGRSLNSIVNEWRRLEVVTTLGNPWTATSLKVTLRNPRLCGWRSINKELVRDDYGRPVVGRWEPILTPEQWLAINAVLDARKGRMFYPDGTIGEALTAEHHQPHHLLTGILRCGRPAADGSLCNAPLRVTGHRQVKSFLYCCPAKSAGGCGGVARRGDLIDQYISEAVLAKLDERVLVGPDVSPWPGEQDLIRQREKLARLQAQWEADQISDDLFFRAAPALENRIKQLRNEQAKHALTAQRVTQASATDIRALRERWYKPEEEGGLPVSQKRAYVREALHAVILHPAGRGRKPFNPDLLEPIWRE